MSKIKSVDALEILDSRGNPTIQVSVTLESGVSGTAKIPSGASTGKHEAVELRDGDKARYKGKGVLKAVHNVTKLIQGAVKRMDASHQKSLDEEMIALDGTPNKSKLGANAILGVSIAAAKAAAAEKKIPLYRQFADHSEYVLPVPQLNVLNGGRHADNNVDFQEFMIVPVGAPSFSEALRAAAETFQTLKQVLHEKGYETSVGDEGGFAPRLRSNEEPMELILSAIEKAGYKPGKDIGVNLDPAASEFYDNGQYVFHKSDKTRKSSDEMIALWADWMQKYPIFSLEDGLAEDDWAGWKKLTSQLGDQVQLVGDDIFVTNPEIFAKGIKEGVANSILIKLNQIGTVTEIRFGERAKARIRTREGNWKDILISDLKQYVTEELNPENQKGVQGAEVFVPSPLLSSGMCIVDTPGLGSVFTGNTAATQAFIPHIDAALVVVGADPPLAGDELTIVEEVGKNVQQLILVLNKADRTTDAEREAASKFTRQLLHKKLRHEVGPVFEVSAQERAESRGPERDWRKLIQALQSLVDDSRRELVRAACDRGLERLSEQVLAIISEHRDALRRPIEESERRITVMKQTIVEAERSMRELSFLFMAEQQRLSDLFVDRHKAFVSSALPKANEQFEVILRSTPCKFGPSYRRAIMKDAQQVAHHHVVPWLRTEQEEAEREYRCAAMRFVEMGNDFLRKLAMAGIPELARMPHALDLEAGFRVRSQFTFMEFIELAQPASPLRWLADVLLPVVGARKMIENDAREFLVKLIETNSTRVQSDILNRVQESRGRLEVEIRKLLHEASRIAEQALIRARKTKNAGESAVEAELKSLDALEAKVSGFRNRPLHPVMENGLILSSLQERNSSPV